MRVSRRDKKKLKAIFLCHTGNPDCAKSKLSKKEWVLCKNDYRLWLSFFEKHERKWANLITKNKSHLIK